MAEITPAILRKWKILSKWADEEELDNVVFVNCFQTGKSPDELGALVLTTDDEVFHVGCAHGLFGVEGETKTKVDALSGLGLKKVEVGGAFCVALTSDEKLYFWGNPYPTKIPESAYICYEKFQSETHCCIEEDHHSLRGTKEFHYYQAFEFGGVVFRGSCPNCLKDYFTTYTLEESKGKNVVRLVKFEVAAIRCTKCRRRCTAYKIGGHEVNYCAFCNYLPQDAESFDDVTSEPQLIELGDSNKVVDIAGGSEFFVALTNHNFLILWGKICLTKYQGTVYNPTNAVIKAVSCGGNHVAALSVEGDVYTCGLGDKGQLGYDWTPEMGYETLRKVPLGGKVQKVCCGYSSTVCLMDDGALMCFGTNMKLLSTDVLMFFGKNMKSLSADVLALNQPQHDFISKPARIMQTLRVIDLVNSPLTNVFCAKTDTLMFIWGRETDQSPQPELVLGEQALMAALANLPATFNFKSSCTPPSSLSNQQDSELYGNKFLSDLILKLADGDFPVHRLILRANSVYFHKTFEGNDSDNVLDMSHYNPEAYKCLLKYFYQVPPTDLNPTDLFDLYMLANTYKETAIAQEVFVKLKANLNPETILPLLRKAKNVNCSEFLAVCNSFVDSPEFKHIVAEKVSKDLDKTLSFLEVLSTKND